MKVYLFSVHKNAEDDLWFIRIKMFSVIARYHFILGSEPLCGKAVMHM